MLIMYRALIAGFTITAQCTVRGPIITNMHTHVLHMLSHLQCTCSSKGTPLQMKLKHTQMLTHKHTDTVAPLLLFVLLYVWSLAQTELPGSVVNHCFCEISRLIYSRVINSSQNTNAHSSLLQPCAQIKCQLYFLQMILQ